MADVENFLENLRHLGSVLAAAVSHVRHVRHEFLLKADEDQMYSFESLVTRVRTASEQLEREFNLLEYLATTRRNRQV